MSIAALQRVHARLRACRRCPDVCDRAVHGPALRTPIMLIGQAPGVHEGSRGRPFAHTAGRTLFKWFEEATGADEETIRENVYFSAIARCFPGKAKSGQGDRPPSPVEIANCSSHLREEILALKPQLIVAVGKIAILETLRAAGVRTTTPLNEIVGKKFETEFHGHAVEVIALPHPSGVSRWPHTVEGRSRLAAAQKLLRQAFAKLL